VRPACQASLVSDTGRIGAGAAGVLGLALVLAQLLLPRFVASRIASRVGRYGAVQSVSVSAWPAVKLLWGSADSVVVRAGALAMTPSQAADLLGEGGGAGRVHASARSLQLGPLRLTGVSLSGHGHEVSAEASASDADIAAALPAGVQVQLLRSDHGRVRVRVNGGLFGVAASVDAVAEPSDGAIVVRPQGLLLQTFQLRLFADPRVRVQGLGASAEPGPSAGYRLAVSAALG
jgi:hypothetical protein